MAHPVFEVTTIVLVIAALLAVVSMLQPVADRLRLPSSVLLAAVGVAIGTAATLLVHAPVSEQVSDIVRPIVDLPVRSSIFLYVFLPLLLFHSALPIDVPRIAEDAAPILLLAVVAVAVTTAVVGLAMSSLFGLSLVACLLLGAIVATTDPAAVVAVFRDIGAPARLSRLVEGESLLNDAAAIAIFGVLLSLLLRGTSIDPLDSILAFVTIFVGGMAFGLVAGKLLVFALGLTGNHKAAEATLTVAATYGVFIVGDHVLHVSGVVAVVALGLSVSGWGRFVVLPDNWQHLHNVWDQIGFWAGSLIFIMASILVPKLVTDLRLTDALMVLALVAAALAARALVLFVLLPSLSYARLTKPVSLRYKTVILWGGLRGAVTLALALAVVENNALAPDVKRFVGVVATGFVLFVLLVNGTTLRLVIAVLKLDRLSPLDRMLRDQIVALSLVDVRDAVREAGQRYELEPAAIRPALDWYESRVKEAYEQSHDAHRNWKLTDRERLAIALVALAERERELLLEHRGKKTLSRAVTDALLRNAARIVEATRTERRCGYLRAARQPLEYRLPFRIAHFLHRSLRIDWPLTRQVGERFEVVLVTGLILAELKVSVRERLAPLFGPRIARLAEEILETRLAAIGKAASALRLQYPEYAQALEAQFLRRLGLRHELDLYDELHREGLLHGELYDDLRQGVTTLERGKEKRLRLDLGLNVRDMVERIELFHGLAPDHLDRICTLCRSRLAVPGEAIVRKGDRGTRAYFISSGAVEVRLTGQTVRLAGGDVFGELALLGNGRRTADVVALGYCQLLTLEFSDFHRFLDLNPEIRAHVERVAKSRVRPPPSFDNEVVRAGAGRR